MQGTPQMQRYRVDTELGRGGRAIVHAGHDLLLDRPVALKRALSIADEPLLLEEARRLARVRSSRVVGLYDVLQGPPCTLVLELLDGSTLRDILRGRHGAPPQRAGTLLREVLEALRDLHDAGLAHGDVKPENLATGRGGQPLRLLDVGALGDATAIYAAPEASPGCSATPAADVYAAGVVGFELFSGRLPFDATDPHELAVRKRNTQAPSVRSAGASVPRRVEAWFARALHPDPDARYADAGVALAAWNEAQVALESVTRPASESPVLQPAAWLRAEELLVAAVHGGTGALAVVAAPGHGKTALVRRWTDRARRRGMIVLNIRMPPSLRRDAYAAWHAARRASPTGGLVPAPRSGRRARSETAEQERIVRAMLRAPRPVAIAVDQLETCDAPTRRLVLRLLEAGPQLELAMLITIDDLACGRAADACRGALEDLGVPTLHLDTPAVESWRPFIAHALRSASPSDALVEHVRTRSGGNPRLALDLLDDLRMRGALQTTGDGWAFRSELSGSGPPAAARATLERLLARVGLDDRELLQIAALHGDRFDPAALALHVGVPAAALAERLQQLVPQRLLERDGDAFRFRVPLVAARLREELTPERTRAEHAAAAAALEALENPDRAALGTHLYHAGERARALPHLEGAGTERLAQRDAGAALPCLDLACAAAEALVEDEASARRRVDVGLLRTRALQQLASWTAAREEIERVSITARAWGLDASLLQVLVLLGEVEYAQGRFDEALQAWLEVLHATPRQSEPLLLQEVALKIGNVHFERGDLTEAASQYERVLAWATAAQHADLEARAAHNVALVESIQGRKERAVEFFNRSLERFTALGRTDAVARIDQNIGQIYLELGNWAEARNFFSRSMQTSEASGQDHILAAACLDSAEASIRLGALDEASEAIERALGIGRERGDEVGVANAYRLQATLAATRGDGATAEARLLESIDMLQRLGHALQLGLCWKDLASIRLQAGRTDAARDALAEARRLFASLDAAQHVAEIEMLHARIQEVDACRT